MAYQLANYTTDSGIPLATAYLVITAVAVQQDVQTATISYAIYANQAAAAAGSAPVKQNGCIFTDNLYTANFAAAVGTNPLGAQPTNVDAILQLQTYLALKNHPSLATLLAGATMV